MLDVGEAELDFFNSLSNITKKHSKMNKRFSDEQIKSLETIFESESKLEPRKKLRLAQELGLQPRQVAIWFQNRRARWKSKQLERDYNMLKATYDSLSSQFDLLKTENQSLVLQLKKLHELMEKNGEPQGTVEEAAKEKKPSLSYVGSEDEDDSSIKTEYGGLELDHMLLVEQGEGSLTNSADNWDDLDTHDPLLHHSTITDTSNQWWDYWC